MTLRSLVPGSRRFGAFVLRVSLPLLLTVFTLAVVRDVRQASAAAKLSPELIDQALERMGCTVWREGGADWFAQAVWQGSCGDSVRTVVTAPEGFSDADLAQATELLADAPGVAIWLESSAVTSQGLEALAKVEDLQAVSVSAGHATPAVARVVSQSPKLTMVCLDGRNLQAESVESTTMSLQKVRPTLKVLRVRPKLGC
jgi:hypothetical protein